MIRTTIPQDRSKAGRKTIWTDDIPDRVEFMCTRGFTDNDVAKALGVSIQTVDNWKRTREEFYTALQRGKVIPDNNVERAFYDVCIGYSHPDTYITQYKGEVIKVPTIKHYPPNAWACYKWLTIRCRDRWADVHKAEVTNTINIQHIDVEDFSDEELRLLEQIGMKRLVQASPQ